MKRSAAVLLVVGCLGGTSAAYGAEAPTPTPAPSPTVSVVGVATVPISQVASQAEANAVYRQGLTAAIGDGHEKAEFLAFQTGAKAGSIQQIVERGGSIECLGHTGEGQLTEYETYKGAQPDFGSVESSDTRVLAATQAPVAVARKTTPTRKKKKRKVKAKKAAAVSCTLSTQVMLSYLLT
jgi:hypothetical protein